MFESNLIHTTRFEIIVLVKICICIHCDDDLQARHIFIYVEILSAN